MWRMVFRCYQAQPHIGASCEAPNEYSDESVEMRG